MELLANPMSQKDFSFAACNSTDSEPITTPTTHRLASSTRHLPSSCLLARWRRVAVVAFDISRRIRPINRPAPALKAISIALELGIKEASAKNTEIDTAAEVSSRGRRTVLATTVERFWKKMCMAVSIYCANEKAHR